MISTPENNQKSLAGFLWSIAKVALVMLVVLGGLFFLFQMGLALLHVDASAFAHVSNAVKRSPLTLILRLCVYVGLWFAWTPIIRYYAPELPPEHDIFNRKRLLMICAGYEALCWVHYFL